METRNLITFVHVAELGSFTKAAQTLGYSQSTVSFQIKQLETELDCLLFERINHTVSLTDRGRQLLSYAHEITALTDAFMQRMNSPEVPAGYIHFVTPDSVCEDMLLRRYADFHRHYPGIDLKFTNADTAVMFDMLDRNEADAVITLDSHIYRKEYVIAKEKAVGVHFVANPRSAFAGKKDLSIRDITNAPFILTEKGMGYRRVLDKELAKQSIEIAPILEVGRTDIIIRLLEENDCISFLPDFTTEKKVREGSLIYLDVRDVKTEIWKQLIHHRDKWLSNAMQACLSYVKAHEFEENA